MEKMNDITIDLRHSAKTAHNVAEMLDDIRNDIASNTSTIDLDLLEAILEDLDDVAAQLEMILDENSPLSRGYR